MMQKKKWFPNPYTIIFFLTIISAILTHVLPAGHYNYQTEDTHQTIQALDVPSYTGSERLIPIPGTYQHIEPNPQGIVDVFMAPILGTIDAIDIIIFILIIGAYITTIMETGAFDTGINALIKKLKGKEQILIFSIVVLFSFLGTVEGWQEETTAFYPLLIPILVKAGYDPLLAIVVILISSWLGIAASVVNPFSVGIAAKFAGISLINGITFRFVMYIVFIVLVIIFLRRYARKIKKNIKSSYAYDAVEYFKKLDESQLNIEANLTTRHKWILIVFLVTFVTMVYGLIPFEKFGYPNLSLGWWFTDISALFLFSTLLTGIIAGFKEPKIIETIKKGLSNFIPVACVIGLSRGISIILKHGYLEDTFLNFFTQMLSGLPPVFFIILAYFLFIALSFIITSTSAMATLTMPILAPLAVMLNVNPAILISAYSFGMGTTAMINPGDPILNVALSNGRINYLQWVRFIRPFALAFMLTSIIALSIAVSFK